MSKLPINLLLYVAILALTVASGQQFYNAFQERGRKLDQKRNRAEFSQLFQRGQDEAGQVSPGPNYGAKPEFWNSLQTANLIGKEPPPPPPDANSPEYVAAEVREVPEIDLSTIVSIDAIVFAGEDSRVVLHYQPSANVTPPPEVLDDLPGGSSGPGDALADRPTTPTRPGGRPAARPSPMPSFGGSTGPTHYMQLDEQLWDLYSHVRLVRVDPDARFAVFRVEKPGVPEEEWVEEEIFPERLSLSQDVLRKLAEGFGTEIRGPQRAPEPESSAAPISGGWVDMSATTEVAQDRYNVGRNDLDRIRRDPQRLFNEDIGTANWKSKSGNMSGVKVTRVPDSYQSFGVQQGDVVLSINGQKVSSKSQAIKVGKQLHKTGVRSFEVEFLTGRGERVTRSYVAPDE